MSDSIFTVFQYLAMILLYFTDFPGFYAMRSFTWFQRNICHSYYYVKYNNMCGMHQKCTNMVINK